MAPLYIPNYHIIHFYEYGMFFVSLTMNCCMVITSLKKNDLN